MIADQSANAAAPSVLPGEQEETTKISDMDNEWLVARLSSAEPVALSVDALKAMIPPGKRTWVSGDLHKMFEYVFGRSVDQEVRRRSVSRLKRQLVRYRTVVAVLGIGKHCRLIHVWSRNRI